MKEEFKEYRRIRGYYGLRSDNRPPQVGAMRLRQLGIREHEKAVQAYVCSLCDNLTYSESGICAACSALLTNIEVRQ
jgi:hypothetical protein